MAGAIDAAATPSGPRRARAAVFGAVFVPLVAVYSLTAHWGLPYSIDALTNAITGWYIGNEGTVIASHHEVLVEPKQHGNLAWFVETPDGPVGQYPPGAALVAGLAYAVTPGGLTEVPMAGDNRPYLGFVPVGVPPLWPATLSAVLTTAAAAAVLALVFLRISGDRRAAIAGGLIFGLATGAWAVASAQSLTHGPAMLAVALALLAVQRDRWALAGAAFACAILTRPHLAVVAAATGLGVSFHRRSPRPAIVLGLVAATGLVALVAYNAVVWDDPSVSGGYPDDFGANLAHSSLGWFLGNTLRGLLDPRRGLLVWAPFVVVLAIGTIAQRRRLEDWSAAAAIGGICYLLIQFRANRFGGGDGHFGYRYPLELLTAGAPALFVGYQTWVRTRPTAQKLMVAGLAVAFAGQLGGSVS